MSTFDKNFHKALEAAGQPGQDLNRSKALPIDTDHFPRRLQIVSKNKRLTPGNYFKTGQFAYATGVDNRGGNWCIDTDRESAPGERAYLISKTKDSRGGALWISEAGIRFTGK